MPMKSMTAMKAMKAAKSMKAPAAAPAPKARNVMKAMKAVKSMKAPAAPAVPPPFIFDNSPEDGPVVERDMLLQRITTAIRLYETAPHYSWTGPHEALSLMGALLSSGVSLSLTTAPRPQ